MLCCIWIFRTQKNTMQREVYGLGKRFLLVDAAVLPEVFLRVLEAKELLASRRARNISSAVKMAGLSRSAFYKYKDCVYDAQDSAEVTTVHATLRDETGALHSLLEAISGAGASIVTINQSTPESGTARVSVSFRTGGMHLSAEALLAELRRQPTVVDIRRGV